MKVGNGRKLHELTIGRSDRRTRTSKIKRIRADISPNDKLPRVLALKTYRDAFTRSVSLRCKKDLPTFEKEINEDVARMLKRAIEREPAGRTKSEWNSTNEKQQESPEGRVSHD